MSNFIGMVFASLKKEGIDTKGMSTDDAVKKYNELQKKTGGKAGADQPTPAENKKIASENVGNTDKVIDKFWEKAGFGTESKNVNIKKVEGSKVYFTYMGQPGVFDTEKPQSNKIETEETSEKIRKTNEPIDKMNKQLAETYAQDEGLLDRFKERIKNDPEFVKQIKDLLK